MYKYNDKVNGNLPIEKKEDIKINTCTDKCRNCIYMRWLNSTCRDMFCAYILIKGVHRPCDGGDDCTVMVERTKDHHDKMKKFYKDSLRYGKKRYMKQW